MFELGEDLFDGVEARAVGRQEDQVCAPGQDGGSGARLIRIAFLAPDLKRAILDGVQPEGLTLQAVMTRELPLAWDAQRRLYAG